MVDLPTMPISRRAQRSRLRREEYMRKQQAKRERAGQGGDRPERWRRSAPRRPAAIVSEAVEDEVEPQPCAVAERKREARRAKRQRRRIRRRLERERSLGAAGIPIPTPDQMPSPMPNVLPESLAGGEPNIETACADHDLKVTRAEREETRLMALEESRPPLDDIIPRSGSAKPDGGGELKPTFDEVMEELGVIFYGIMEELKVISADEPTTLDEWSIDEIPEIDGLDAAGVLFAPWQERADAELEAAAEDDGLADGGEASPSQ